MKLLSRARRFLQRFQGSPQDPLLRMPNVAGSCNVCGRTTTFHYDDWQTARESLVCLHCRCTSRYRSLAKGLLRAVEELRGVRADSLAELRARASAERLTVYDTQVAITAERGAYPTPSFLAGVPWIDLRMSVFKTALAWGAAVDRGVTNQNLEALTFPDASFDVVLTSDVMEHVRLAADAHREIRRILRPGGVYLFTVPHDRSRATTLERVRIVDPADPGRDEFLMEPEYHGDANSPDNRALAYRLFGLDLDAELQGLGFEVDYTREDDLRHGIANTELFYCRVTGETVAPLARRTASG